MKNNTTMAIEHINSYPHFVANQVLKSSDLNHSFGFLDEQARLSRLHLVGQGIIEGLDVSYKNGVLTVGKGVALDSGGWVVQLTEDSAYKFVAEVPFSETPFDSDNLEDLAVSGGGRVGYICFKTSDDALELGLKPVAISKIQTKDLLVALAYGTKRELSNRCSHDSCDINVTSLLVEAWPVLVKAGPRPLYKSLAPFNSTLLPYESCYLKIGTGNIKEFNKLIEPYFKNKRDELVNSLKSILSNLFGQKYVAKNQRKKSGFTTKATAWDHVFPDCRRLLGRLHGCILKTENYCPAQKTDHIRDYYLSFLDDLRQAVSEFIEAYNEFAAETVRIPDWIPESRFTFLGTPFKADGDCYRSYFRKADAFTSQSGAIRLGRMLRRICVLSEHFIGSISATELAKMSINIVAVKPGARLSEKPIPFYYRTSQTPEFLENWNADKCSSFRAVPDYESHASKNTKNNPLLLPQHGMNLFLEAYQYKAVNVIKNSLLYNRSGWWRNITVKTIDYQAVKRLSPSQQEFLNKYFAVDDFPSKYSDALLQKLTGNAQSLVRTLNSLWKSRKTAAAIAKDIQAFRDGVGSGLKWPKKKVDEMIAAMDGLWEMTRAFKAVVGLTYEDKKNKFADPVYSAFLGLFNCIIHEEDTGVDLCYAILCGPIYPDSTVILMTENEKVFTYAVLY